MAIPIEPIFDRHRIGMIIDISSESLSTSVRNAYRHRPESTPPAGAERFRSLVQDLAAIYREHIAIEEGEVFPFAASALSKTERERMGSEMAARTRSRLIPLRKAARA
jgi:hypothetical protein